LSDEDCDDKDIHIIIKIPVTAATSPVFIYTKVYAISTIKVLEEYNHFSPYVDVHFLLLSLKLDLFSQALMAYTA